MAFTHGIQFHDALLYFFVFSSDSSVNAVLPGGLLIMLFFIHKAIDAVVREDYFREILFFVLLLVFYFIYFFYRDGIISDQPTNEIFYKARKGQNLSFPQLKCGIQFF